MRRSERCRNAAENVLYAVDLAAGGDPYPEEEARRKARADIERILYREFARGPDRAIDDLLDEARRHELNVRMSGEDPRDHDPDFVPPDERLRTAMTQGLKELEEITGHVCSYAEDEASGDLICGVCGSSGLS